MKKLFLLLAICLSNFFSFCQESDVIEDQSLLNKYLAQSKFEIDSSAQAIILYEKGMVLSNSNAMSYKVERTIKIIGKDALKEATIAIPLRENSSIRKIVGITYNLENGTINEQRIERSEIIKDNVTDNVNVAKFNLPSVKEGSIIHYSYIIESPWSAFVPDWYFQGEFPKLYSEYEIVIPAFIVYTAVERIGKIKTKVRKRSELKNCDACLFSAEISNDENNNVWVRKNVPAFKEEPFMLAKDNYIERIKVQVTAISYDGYTKAVQKDWNQLNQDVFYKNEKLCGQVFAGNGFLKDKTEELTKSENSESGKAKALFQYIRDNFSRKNSREYDAQNIKEVFRKKEGNVYGINLLLAAMMRKAGLKSEPVLLATRDEECLNSFYADPSNINYIVTRVNLEGKDYFLDASEKYISFGLLNVECYNGFARSVNEKGSSVYLTPDSIRDRSVTIATIVPSSENPDKLIIKADYTIGNITGYSLRKAWHNDSVLAYAYVQKNLNKGSYDFKVTNKSIRNLSDPDLPLKISIEAEIELNSDLLYLDPYLDKFFDKNPFPANARMFPVTMDYKQDATYVLSFQLPPNYTLDDYPKSTAAKFEDEGMIEIQNVIKYDKEKNHLRLQNHLTTNTTIFPIEEYEPLREFYDHIIDGQNKKIVLKKIN